MLASHYRRLGIVLAAVLLLAAGPFAAIANAQTAGPSFRLAATPVLPVNLTTQGFVLPGPNPRPAGLATFHVTTPDRTGHYWATFNLKNGVTLAQVSQWFHDGELPDLSISVPALHALYTNVDFTGGVAVYPTSAIDLTIPLKPNTTTYITDTVLPDFGGGGAAAANSAATPAASKLPPALRAVGAAADRALAQGTSATADETPSPFAVLVTTGTTNLTVPPAFNSALEAVDVNGRAKLLPVGQFKGTGAFLFRNDATLPQEAQFEHIDPGTTDADVQAFYTAQLNHTGGVPYPFRGEPGGILLLSKGDWVIMGTTFPAGQYCILSFPTDWDTGVKQAFEGVHQVVTLH